MEKEVPKISVVVPVYKVEKYLPRCIESVLAQTFSDFELILVDDGSPDTCGAICDEYAVQDSRIRVIHQKNAGVSIARNNGIRAATGEYVTFVDSDDWIATNFLERMYQACLVHNAQMAFCRHLKVYSEEVPEQTKGAISEKVMDSRKAMEFYGVKNLLENDCAFRSPWGKLIKRTIVCRNLFPTDRIYAEDAACVYRWIWATDRIVDVGENMYYYFQNENGICQARMGKHISGNFKTEDEWISFFKSNNFDELYYLTCKRYINDGMWFYRGVYENENQEDIRIAHRTLQNGLIKYGKKSGVLPKSHPWLYETAFPRFMKIYWVFVAQKNKLRRKR